MLKRDDVLQVAKLARLELSDAQVKKFSEQLNSVFELFKKIEKVELDNVEETSQVTGLRNVFKKDEIKCDEQATTCSTDNLLSNIPYREENKIIVPRIIEER
ncbi:MAG: Asp-tRNA(Asn)/Glu-tRNA(Gln) amidotransferase subunit GatC [Candidatus Berkelbacteria bacterium]|nr:Asp-tRNA(Asn)/Glu-tRNA(Gln) amidotransferase subunit GatC [Candidatus Berkelbacteria bacterium]